MEVAAELSSFSHVQGACSWKVVQRRLSPNDSLFEAGDIACHVRVHKYVSDTQSYSSNVDVHSSVKYVAVLMSFFQVFTHICVNFVSKCLFSRPSCTVNAFRLFSR